MKRAKWIVFVLCAALLVCAMTACGGGGDNGSDVSGIEVTKQPDKAQYSIGETFSAAGGELTATMADGTTKVVPLTDPDVTLTAVSTDSAGTKQITVTYGGARVRFSVEVKPITVSFDLGGVPAAAVEAISLNEPGRLANRMPAAPACEGYEFSGWYFDAAHTEAFDESREISGDITLYAAWTDTSKTYYTVTFDGNYYGAQAARTQSVENGAQANPPSDLTRNGYQFDGWFTQAEGGNPYDFGAVSADTTVYAHWTKTASGTNEYVFEAELIDFTGKQGPGYSGSTPERGMIQSDVTGTASNGSFVGYSYLPGMTHDFHFAADAAADDATIVLRLSVEFADMIFDPNNFTVSLNGTALSYDAISLEAPEQFGTIRSFEDFTITTNAHINEGENIISLVVSNGEPPTDASGAPLGTMRATAPLIDCVKITTSSVLYWDGSYDMPGPLPR